MLLLFDLCGMVQWYLHSAVAFFMCRPSCLLELFIVFSRWKLFMHHLWMPHSDAFFAFRMEGQRMPSFLLLVTFLLFPWPSNIHVEFRLFCNANFLELSKNLKFQLKKESFNYLTLIQNCQKFQFSLSNDLHYFPRISSTRHLQNLSFTCY